MKKVLLVLFCLMTIISCSTPGIKSKVNVVYEVHYPSMVDTHDETYNVELHGDNPEHPNVYLRSHRGSNYLYIDTYLIYATTAPIKVISYKTVSHE